MEPQGIEISPLKVNISERDMEDYLYNNPRIVNLPGLGSVKEWIGRQITVASGVIDLVGIFEDGRVIVVELKNRDIVSQDLCQVTRYASDIDQILSNCDSLYRAITVIIFKGEEIPNSVLMESTALCISLMSFKVMLTGFVSGPWHFTKEAFDEFRNKNDKTYKEFFEQYKDKIARYEEQETSNVEPANDNN